MDNLVIGKKYDDDSDTDSYISYDSTDSEYSGPRDMSVVISDLEELKKSMFDMMLKIDQLDDRKPPNMISQTSKLPSITASSLKLDDEDDRFDDIKLDKRKKKPVDKSVINIQGKEVKTNDKLQKNAEEKLTKTNTKARTKTNATTSAKTSTKTSTKTNVKSTNKKETVAERKARLKKHMENRAAEVAAKKTNL